MTIGIARVSGSLASVRVAWSPLQGPSLTSMTVPPGACVTYSLHSRPARAEGGRIQLRSIVQEMLTNRYPRETVEELAELLTQGSWTHDYPINFDQAKGLGLNVSDEIATSLSSS